MRRHLLFAFGVALVIGAGVILGIGMSIRTEKVIPDENHWNIDSRFDSSFEKLGNSRIFFGHQSVGQNIVDGVGEIRVEDEELCLEIVEEKEFNDSRKCVLFHSKIGRNTRPESKIRAFKKIMAHSVGKDVNIALMKFCYVDINRDSDPRMVFDAYSKALAELKEELPGTVFVHVTVPLESMPRTAEGALKHFVKRIIGRPGVIDDNTVRCRYNDLLREHYSGKEPIFDLAAVESLDAPRTRVE